ncbi:small ribosomal subunit protein mS37-like [Physella acuta]|uniref:small ribosomal subunit protein mS37-like n=1 Tax=Physella acuta TaxID=109671 RepID=UPI0027DCCC5E|nr:small ribosomal subunit protein mS37-like [Physella acuta]XP_059168363.1 small ribosomal subunit protein mS37-like [Physella acuta]XP_059168364.1 small ribosomal subunit protein mS37-like [Physella acuta]XP_059168365.1 small ribosomal subunit protein mS37-like [Physella acuta]XP_059168367.1 small ribosomal subunit protein mS37-like [Physella acuta]XP_059168368.1 small ribosomal subunit protein mS37-like [Physella acuta]
MKLTEVCCKTCSLKKFTNYRDLGYRFKVLRIPALKDSITSRHDEPQAGSCVNEMSRLMDCWKSTDYNPTSCSKETQVFINCIQTAQIAAREAKARVAKGLPAAKGSSLYPSKQVNQMLARYPQPKSNFID